MIKAFFSFNLFSNFKNLFDGNEKGKQSWFCYFLFLLIMAARSRSHFLSTSCYSLYCYECIAMYLVLCYLYKSWNFFLIKSSRMLHSLYMHLVRRIRSFMEQENSRAYHLKAYFFSNIT